MTLSGHEPSHFELTAGIDEDDVVCVIKRRFDHPSQLRYVLRLEALNKSVPQPKFELRSATAVTNRR
jgi:hypothetical protein